MGSNTSTARAPDHGQGQPEAATDAPETLLADKAGPSEPGPAASETMSSSAAGAPRQSAPLDDAAMDEEQQGEADDRLECGFDSLKVKDEHAWKHAERPRSAMKHSEAQSGVSGSAADEFVERTPSGRKLARKVSFQVNGLQPPMEVEGPKEKRVKKLDESSMKKLVDTFYGKVFAVDQLRPFFDGVDMAKLKHQQEALMLLVFGGNELLDDEHPGLSADLRLIHLHLLYEGLSLADWEAFADQFDDTIDQAPGIPDEIRAKAKGYMRGTQQYFRPLEAGEWPPAQPYKGWTKASCPFATSVTRVTATAAAAEGLPAAPAEAGGAAATAGGAITGDGGVADRPAVTAPVVAGVADT